MLTQKCPLACAALLTETEQQAVQERMDRIVAGFEEPGFSYKENKQQWEQDALSYAGLTPEQLVKLYPNQELELCALIETAKRVQQAIGLLADLAK